MTYEWNVALTGEVLIFKLLSKALYVFPERSWVESLVQNDIFSEAPFAAEHPDVVSGLALVQRWSRTDNGRLSDQMFDDLRADYTRLFIGPGQVLTPPWESVYFSEERLTFQKETLEVRNWYKRFGLQSAKVYSEPDDHIGLELEFLAHLATLGLEAFEKNDAVKFERMLDAQRGFLAEHLLRWAPEWCAQVHAHATTGLYRGISLVTRGAVEETAKMLSVTIPARKLEAA
jgi:putative dimethyl sulfoxide reductase chaperone